MNNRDLLYSNRFIPHPDEKQTNIPSHVLQQYNIARNNRVIRNHSRDRLQNNQIHHRVQPRKGYPAPQQTMFTDQLIASKKDAEQKEFRLKRTPITINSENRQKTTHYTSKVLFPYAQSHRLESMTIENDANKTLRLQFTVTASSYSRRLIENLLERKFEIILQNLSQYPKDTSSHPNTFLGVPLRHLNYDGTSNYPLFSFNGEISTSSQISDDVHEMTIQFQTSIIAQMISSNRGNVLKLYNEDQSRTITDRQTLDDIESSIHHIEVISTGFQYPRHYKINLGYKFKNVVAVRMLSTVIPNTAYMVNSTTRKNNKIKWINEFNRTQKANAELYTDSVFDESMGDMSNQDVYTPSNEQQEFFESSLNNTFPGASWNDNEPLSWTVKAVFDNETQKILEFIIQGNLPLVSFDNSTVSFKYLSDAIDTANMNEERLSSPTNWFDSSVYHFCEKKDGIWIGFTIVKNNEHPTTTFREEMALENITHLFPHSNDSESFSNPVQLPNELHTYGLAKKEIIFSLHTTSLLGGNYTAETLAEEMEKELNHTLKTSSVFNNSLNFYSWKSSQFLSYGQANDKYRLSDTHPLSNVFSVTTDDKKKIIQIEQLKTIFYNNHEKIDPTNHTKTYASPLIVNSGLPYLYVHHPGTILRSGDNIRIQNAFDIFNIRDTEINREHQVIVCATYKYAVNIVSPSMDSKKDVPFQLFEIISVEKNLQKNPLQSNVCGRIVKWEEEIDAGKYTVTVEMMDDIPFVVGQNIVGMTSNVVAEIESTSVSPNSHHGYNVKLPNVPTRTNLTGIGTEQLFIGTSIPYKILWGLPETARYILGFDSDNSGEGETQMGRISFDTSISNTVKKNIVDISSVEVSPTCDEDMQWTVSVNCMEQCSFSPGDRIFITNHHPFLQKLQEKETFGVGITKIVKQNSSEIDPPIRLFIERETFQKKHSSFGEIPEIYQNLPFSLNSRIFICNHERSKPAFSNKIVWVNVSRATYQKGEVIDQYPTATVARTAVESNRVLLEFANESEASAYRNSILRTDSTIPENLYYTVGIPDGSYIINDFGVDGDDNLFIDIDATWSIVNADNNENELLQQGFGRLEMPEYSVTLPDPLPSTENVILTPKISQINPVINQFREELVYIHDNVSGFFTKTIPNTNPYISTEKNVIIPYTDELISLDSENINVRLCSSDGEKKSVLNNHNGFIVSDVDTSKMQFQIKIPKSMLPLNPEIISNVSCSHLALRKRFFESVTSNVIGKFGEAFMKEVDKPYTIQEKVMFLQCPTLKTIQTTEKSNLQNVFAKILLPGKSGQYVFNTFVTTPTVFHEHPLRELHELEFQFVNQRGETIDFNELDHSITLEIVEAVERLDSLNMQMSK